MPRGARSSILARMRTGVVTAFLAGCAGAAPQVSQLPPTSVAVTASAQPKRGNGEARFTALDPITSLSPARESDMVAWVIPGQAQLDLGAVPIDTAPRSAPELPTTILDEQGPLVRVAIRLEHARFSVWTGRTQLMRLVQRDVRVTPEAHAVMGDMGAQLGAGAHVVATAKRGAQTKVRFVGAIEIEGWVPDAALADSIVNEDRHAPRTPRGTTTMLVISGSIIRAQPRWAAPQLAIVNRGYLLDVLAKIDDEWLEVSYADASSAVHGYYQKSGPPGRTHRTGIIDPATAPLAIMPNVKVASGTCLYARVNGDAIGYIVGDRDVALDAAAQGWWTLAIDTPYGPVQFAARGPGAQALATCAPADAVPPTQLGTLPVSAP